MKNAIVPILIICLLFSLGIGAFFAGAAFSGDRALHYMGGDGQTIDDAPGIRFLLADDEDIDRSIAILFGIASGFIAMSICGVYLARRQSALSQTE